MSDSPATAETNAAPAQAIPSYKAVVKGLDAHIAHWACAAIALTQLKTLLQSIGNDAGSSDHHVCQSISVLADIGVEIANQARTDGDEARDQAFLVVKDAWSAMPARAWRKCGFPSTPDDNERGEEEAFARAVTGFPKHGAWDGDYTLVCIAHAPEEEA